MVGGVESRSEKVYIFVAFELVCLGADAARQEAQVDVFSDATCVFSMSGDGNPPIFKPERQH